MASGDNDLEMGHFHSKMPDLSKIHFRLENQLKSVNLIANNKSKKDEFQKLAELMDRCTIERRDRGKKGGKEQSISTSQSQQGLLQDTSKGLKFLDDFNWAQFCGVKMASIGDIPSE
eukprot:jgi/Bigna1/73954/fgenesh1_pg.27_\